MGYREQLNECTDPVSGDWLEITNMGNATDKEQKVNAAKFAILANLNTFTATQTVAPAAGATGISMTTPVNQTVSMLSLLAADCGAGYGPHISIGRNSNVPTPSAGWLQVVNRSNTAYSLWVDNSGNVRVGTLTPTNANDASGSVVGAQTSWAEAKEEITAWDDNQAALDAILAARLFSYKMKGDVSRREYRGLVIHEEDRGAWFSDNDAENQVPALNMRTIVGYLIGAIQAQQVQIEALKAQVEELKNVNA